MSTPQTNPQLLLGETDAVTRGFLESLFLAAGFRVEVVSDPEEAYRELLASAPDIVVASFGGDLERSLDLLRAVRRDVGLARTPVVILSERTREGEVVGAFEAGADDFVPKPFRARELVARVRRAIDRNRA